MAIIRGKIIRARLGAALKQFSDEAKVLWFDWGLF
jgi:hypothetical protein